MLSLVRRCPRLKSLDLDNSDDNSAPVSAVSVETLVEILECAPMLEFLSSHVKVTEALQCYWEKHGTPLLNITKLRTLVS